MAKKQEKTGGKRYVSIRLKLILSILLGGVLLLFFNLWLLSDSMTLVEDDLMDDRLASDIRYARDEIGGDWNVRDDALYCGDTYIGDGVEVNEEMEAVMQHFEDITGTFFYTFILTDNDDELVWVGDDETGYQQGHYLRTCGTTKGPNGENIVGTYMDVKVANVLDKYGEYSGEANVNGRQIYCRYETLLNPDGEVVGAVVVGRSIVEMEQNVANQKYRAAILIVVVLLLICLGIVGVVSKIVRAIPQICERLDLIGTGHYPEEPLHLQSHDEIDFVAESINDMVESLKEKDRIGAELSLATDIQANMLPRIFPPFPEHDEFEIYATMNPAKEVGGDFYDFFLVDDRHLAMVIADVSGKGVPAALFMVIAKTLIKNYGQMGLEPHHVFTKVNQLLCDSNDAGLFVTAWMAVLDLETGMMDYVNAGHNPPLYKKADGDFEYLRARPGFVLAGMEGMRYKMAQMQLHPGDKLYLYTDGVTEATNLDEELYGEERLLNFLNTHPATATETLPMVRADIDEFVGEGEQFDDITMLMLDFHKLYSDNSGTVEKVFPATLEALPDVLGFIEETLDAHEATPKAQMQIAVAAEEIFVNIAHYAYPGETGKAKIAISVEDAMASIRFIDLGIPFDPLAKADPDVTLSAEDRKIGGLGIYMVKKTMDDLSYKRTEFENILTMKKQILA